ncbi:alanine--tRNA ligase [Patescibacteria group bacterium]|nr:alanine--tRNA ligase [Patescibacteria group bacterium]
MLSTEIRRRYLDFFAKRGHAILPSAPLVPENDPTVLFTTAGMHPLVPYLLGEPHPAGKRLANTQKCVRTQDIEEVGDNRHDTFFEMLGNWSLGDYFKKETISWSWQFLTDPQEGLGLDPNRLYVTVFAGDADAPCDDESITFWKERFASVGITAELDTPLSQGGRIFTMAKDSNWWGPAGQTGPCGPDTEMFYDTGTGQLALPNGMPDFDSGRLLEIWNDVFMQYRKDEFGRFTPLSQQNVDTGMGLERVCLVMQNVPTIFETDLFAPITQAVSAAVPETARTDQAAMRVIADHLRSSVMLIGDGVRPSNKDRGYVLRRLLRRAILHSQMENSDWLSAVVGAVLGIYREPYPELAGKREEIIQVITDESQKFQRTLAQGKREIAKLSRITGQDAFNLYQSYGFPWELTKEYAQSRGITLDEGEFEKEFERHKNLSRTASAGQFASGLADHSEMTVRYHTATHLLHQALREFLGQGVEQRGSNITPERLRFDFSYPEKLTVEQIKAVEDRVNEQIAAGLAVRSEHMAPEAAKAAGAIGLFGHKYGDTVSVYSIGDYSKEICTGPHVKNTSELGIFSITKEEAVSSGVRRIKAVLN